MLFFKPSPKDLNARLVQAVMENDVSRAQKLLKKGADINTLSSGDRKPLIMIAAKLQDSLPMLEMLIQNKCDVNATDSFYNTALTVACCSRNYKLIELLLDGGAKPNIKNINGDTAFSCFLKNIQNRIFIRNNIYALRKEAIKNYMDKEAVILQKLLDNGATENDVKTTNISPSLTSVYSGNVKMVQSLINAGFNMGAKSRDDETPLMLACSAACHDLSDPIIQALIDAKIDVNAALKTSRVTPLITAVQNNYHSAVKMLIRAKADINQCDADGQTPLMYAVKNCHPLIVQTLIQAGADPNIQDNNGDTALIAAMKTENYTPEMFRVIQLLIKHNSKTTIQNKMNESAWSILLKESNPSLLLFVRDVVQQIQTKQATPEEVLKKIDDVTEKTNRNNFQRPPLKKEKWLLY